VGFLRGRGRGSSSGNENGCPVVLLTLTDEDLCGKVEVIAVVARVHKPQTSRDEQTSRMWQFVSSAIASSCLIGNQVNSPGEGSQGRAASCQPLTANKPRQ